MVYTISFLSTCLLCIAVFANPQSGRLLPLGDLKDLFTSLTGIVAIALTAYNLTIVNRDRNKDHRSEFYKRRADAMIHLSTVHLKAFQTMLQFDDLIDKEELVKATELAARMPSQADLNESEVQFILFSPRFVRPSYSIDSNQLQVIGDMMEDWLLIVRTKEFPEYHAHPEHFKEALKDYSTDIKSLIEVVRMVIGHGRLDAEIDLLTIPKYHLPL